MVRRLKEAFGHVALEVILDNRQNSLGDVSALSSVRCRDLVIKVEL